MAPPAIFTPSLPSLLAAGTLATASIAVWLIRFPGLALSLLAVSLIVGQLVRVPLPGQGGGFLLSDVATALVLLAAIFKWLADRRRKNYELRITNYAPFLILNSIFVFILWSLFTLVIHVPELGTSNFLIAFLYWGRLAATLALLPALLWLFREPVLRRAAQRLFLAAASLLIILGFLQLIFLPNLNLPGWDPHQSRLFSTWLDPNLFGGFLIVVFPLVVGIAMGDAPGVPRPTHRSAAEERRVGVQAKAGPIVIAVAALVALLFTQSRSSLVALVGAVLLLLPFFLWHLRRLHRLARIGITISVLLGAVVALAVVTFFIPDRVAGLLTVDDTAHLRLSSLTLAWQLVEQTPWMGVGYNAYQFAVASVGFGSDPTLHSRAGSDNSLLTIWVTTGLIGVILFLIPWAGVLLELLRRALRGHIHSLAAAVSLVALLLQAQFVNSFLYSHLLITLIVIIALTMSNAQTPRPNE